MKRKLLAWLLCLLLIAVCAGCGKDTPAASETQKTSDTNTIQSAAFSVTDTAPEGLCYEQTILALPDGMDAAQAQCIRADRLYTVSDIPAAAAVWQDRDGNSGALAIPEQIEYLRSVCATENGVAVLGSWGSQLAPVEGESVEAAGSAVLLYDDSGTLLQTIPLNDSTQNVWGILELGGTLYLQQLKGLTAIDDTGAVTAQSAPEGGFLWQSITASDGLWLLSADEVSWKPVELVHLSAALEELGRYDIQDLNVQGLGTDENGALLLLTADAILRPDLESGSLTQLLRWRENLNLSANNYALVCFTDGGLFACSSETEPARFYTRLPEGQTLEEPEEITVFSTGYGLLTLQVCASDFQRLYPQYRVTVTEVETEEARTRALAELGTGGGYDLYYFTNGRSHAELDEQGVFLDLLPLLQTDTDELLDDVVPCVEKALTQNGACYRAPLGYSILTMAANPETLTDYTPSGVLAACEAAGGDTVPFTIALDPTYIGMMAQTCAQDYVDTDSWTCSFTSDSFLDQLRLLKRQMPNGVPEQSEAVDEPHNGLLNYYNIFRPRAVRYMPAAWGLPEMPSYVYAGYPSIRENRGTLELYDCFAINASSAHPDAAWAFLKYLLTEYQAGYDTALPVRDSALRAALEPMIAEGTILQTDVDAFYALLDTLEPCKYSSAAVEEIIQEEVTAYLSGGADEALTADRIQSRVGLLLKEQHG